jgi:hypothetical protein
MTTEYQIRNQARIKAYQKKYYQANKDKIIDRAVQFRKDNPHVQNMSRIKNTYGLTQEEYFRLLEESNGTCPICTRWFGKKLVIDHDHTTGKVRGLICASCNKGLGHFFERIESLQEAIRYLQTKK